jgi:hypothetical protein
VLDDAEVAALHAAVYPIDEGGIGGARGRQPEGYWFKLAGSRASALAHAHTRLLRGDAREAKLVAHVGFRIPDSSTPKAVLTAWIGYEVEWSWAMVNVPQIYPSVGNQFALVSADERYGFAISTYVGTLPWEWDEDETVYEVARWRPHRAPLVRA